MKVKTKDLIGHQLDWAVAKCEGWPIPNINGFIALYRDSNCYAYSKKWDLAGPIIEREGITIAMYSETLKERVESGDWWFAQPREAEAFDCSDDVDAQTPLIAAMRCFVRQKFGEEMEVPDQLL
jgi:hypothetical protein